MSLCAQCGQPTLDDRSLCVFHVTGHGDAWATGNRIMCDFLHRGIVPPSPLGRARDPIDSLVEGLGAAEAA